MIDGILTQKRVAHKYIFAIKSAVSLLTIALAVLLPQIVHIVAGAPGGAKWLPMYLPVLIGGCLLGWRWGLAVGVLSPLASYLVTLMAGNPMPIASRLPFMMAELAVFGFVSGLLSRKIMQNGWTSFAGVVLAELCGRATFIALVAIFQSVSALSLQSVLSQVQTGLTALLLQAVIVPFAVMALRAIIVKDNKESEYVRE